MPMAYDLNLREYWRTVRKRKGIIIFTVVMMTLSSFVFSILGRPTPIYKTSASVKVEKSGSVTGLYIQAVSFSATNYMETQMSMIKSYFIMEIVAKKAKDMNCKSEEAAYRTIAGTARSMGIEVVD